MMLIASLTYETKSRYLFQSSHDGSTPPAVTAAATRTARMRTERIPPGARKGEVG